MRTLVFLLEELSARDLIQGIASRIVPADVQIQYLVFEGKQDLEAQLVRKLRSWLAPNSCFVVLRDQDSAKCIEVKRRLQRLVEQSGRAGVVVRVACRDLESWVLGDWHAVAQAFEKPRLQAQSVKAINRDPDQLHRAVTELRKHVPEYQKRDGARRVGPLLDPSTNRSRSFKVFCAGVQRLLETSPQ